MKTLFSRILVAQVIAVILALAVVTVITRTSLNQGFQTFLERQEAMVLQNIVPALTDLYQQQGGWGFVRDDPKTWQRIWRIKRPPQGGPPPGNSRQGQGRPRIRENQQPQNAGPGLDPELRWMLQSGRGKLRDRLFLLDEQSRLIAGPDIQIKEGEALEEIVVDGETVGWIGFAPVGSALPPDAQRFLGGQLKIMLLAFAAALAFAVVLAWVLARNVSRPVHRIGQTVHRLSNGEFDARATEVTAGEIGTLAVRINHLAESLEKNRTARQRWMADIAHELRTPVAVMKGEVEAIADGVRRADERMAVSLTEEINHLASMVDDLQALALSDVGALNIRKEEVRLTELTEQLLESFHNRMAERGISLENTLEAGVTINGDPQRIRQLLHNLLENSGRYAEKEGTVRLQLFTDDAAVLVLEDSGPGVSDEQLSQLFERFYRAEGSRSRSTGGSGLGLSICRNIAEAHGGTIEADHSPLGGLSIRVILPV